MAKQKEKILEQSAKLFSEAGFFGTSMGEIAQSLNITKPALYYHFKSKKQLYLEVLNRAFEKLSQKFEKISKTAGREKRFFQAVESYLEWGKKEKNLIKVYITRHSKFDPEIKKNVLKLRKTIEEQFISIFREVFIKEVDLKVFTSFLLGTMDRMILEASFLGQRLNIKERAFQIRRMLTLIIGVSNPKVGKTK